LVLSESSGFIGADFGATSHDFSGIGLKNEYVMNILQLLERELKSDSDSQWESFGDGHDDNGHSDDESLGDVGEVLFVSEVTRSECPDVEHKSESESEEHESGGDNTNLTDPDNDTVQFFLERSLLISEIHLFFHLAFVSPETDASNEHLTGSVSGDGSFESEGLSFRCVLVVAFIGEFLEEIFFSSQIRFISFHVLAFNHDSVSTEFD